MELAFCSGASARPCAPRHATPVQPAGPSQVKGSWCLTSAAAAALAAVAARVQGRRSKTRRAGYVTGPGWTDEIARIFDPNAEGPQWEPELGYRGRKRIRLLLDGEDLAHSYAKAEYERTGKWTGPLSAGIEKALLWGAWRGGDPEEVPVVPGSPTMTPPEILTFVAMPADMIESISSACLVDGYPEETRQDLGNVIINQEGLFVNEFLRSLQDDRRLITWVRPARKQHGGFRDSVLMTQKYFNEGTVEEFRGLHRMPILLAQVMGAGGTIKVGDDVESLRSKRMASGRYLPSKWEKAKVLAINYDGTYDLEFPMTWGPYRDRRTKGLGGRPTLSLKKNEIFRDFGADHMPAEFRMMQEMNFAQAVPPSKIRLLGALDCLSDLADTEGNQDWFLCSSKKFYMTHAKHGMGEVPRLETFLQKFQMSYKWVPTAEGLEFQPVPNAHMSVCLKTTHGSVADHFPEAMGADLAVKERLRKMKIQMELLEQSVTQIPPVPPAVPKRAAPLPIYRTDLPPAPRAPYLKEAAEEKTEELALVAAGGEWNAADFTGEKKGFAYQDPKPRKPRVLVREGDLRKAKRKLYNKTYKRD